MTTISVVARIRPAIRSEPIGLNGFLVDGNRICISEKTRTSNRRSNDEYQFDQVFGQSANEADVYKGTGLTLVQNFLKGYNTCLVSLGESGSGKSYTVDGGKGKGGMIPAMIDGIYSGLAEKKAMQRNNQQTVMSPKITLQYYELYNEVLTDLLAPDNKSLKVERNANYGWHVSNATIRNVDSAKECFKFFYDGRGARATAVTELGPVAERSSGIFLLTLEQVEDISKGTTLLSKMMVVDMAGAEKLAEDPTSLHMREGPTMSRSIIAFGHCCKTLASPKEVDDVNYEESKLTTIMSEAFGGNCMTTVMTCLKPSSSAPMRVILSVTTQLLKVNNFPLINTFRLRSLMRRRLIKEMAREEEVDSLKAQRAQGTSLGTMGDNPAKQLIKLHEMEGQLIKETMEKVRMRDENDRLYDKLNELRNKYNELVNMKTDLLSHLIVSEEEKLKVSKALIELQMENNAVKEEAETKNFDLVNKVLSLENDVLELEMRVEKSDKSNEELRNNLTHVKADYTELSDEYVALKSNHVNLHRDNRTEVAKNEELGLELLNLVNAKAALLKEKDAYSMELQKLHSQNQGLQNQMGTIESTEHQRENELVDLRATVERVRTEMMNKQVEGGQKLLTMENQKINFEKQLVELSKLRESDIAILKQEHEERMGKLQDIYNSSQCDIKNLRNEVRRSQRLASETQADLITTNGELATLKAEHHEVMSRIDELAEQYRRRLQQYIRDITDFISSLKNKDDVALRRQLQNQVDCMLSEILNTHSEKQKRLSDTVQKYELKTNDVKQRYERLQRAYKGVLDQLQDNGLEPITTGVDSVDDATMTLPSELSDKEGIKESEPRRLRNEMGRSKKEIHSLKLQLLADAEDHRNTIAKIHAEHESILNSLKTQLEQKMGLTYDDKSRHAIVQGKLIADLRSQLLRENADDLKKTISQYNEENKLMRKMIEEKKDYISNTFDGKVNDFDFEELRALVHAFTSVTQKELEKERSQLMVRATAAEEEVVSLQNYVTTNISSYTKEINRLKMALNGGLGPNLNGPELKDRAAFSKYDSLGSLSNMATGKVKVSPDI